ncbi:MAG TPA: TonB-dependent receptor [Burkholderiales bacterium]|nr:TonB-dependent receptor [Burkholderiales bacterium]
MRKRIALALLWMPIAAGAQVLAAGSLADMSLEDLANLSVTSVSRRAEPLSQAPAALYVITGEDIRRSGVTSLPEALRLAPNLEVARIDSRQYAISARGFNNAIGNKLLVLIDGRTVYTPLFSGVFWDAQDTLLDDVERIEVISGPGATLWGANAVNGVINVITRSAHETRGTLAEAGAGNKERGISARHGFDLNGGAMRIYAKAFERDNTVRANGAAVPDEWHNAQTGFRGDWGSAARGFTLQGDLYRGSIQQAVGDDTSISGGNLLGRITRELAGGSRVQAQVYYDTTQRDIPGSFSERLNTFDAEAQHSFQATPNQLITWGGGHRRAYDRVTNSAQLAFLPDATTLRWTNVFAQDEVALGSRWRLTLGSKLESNVYTGTEFLPSARLAWKLDEHRLVWTAVSRAVRAPSRIDRDLFAPAQPPFLIAGGPDFRSEVAKVYELGYRAQPAARLSYSVTGFYSQYDHLRSVERAGTAFVLANRMEGRGKGIEAWGTLQVTPAWRLNAGALLLDQDLRFEPGSADTNVAAAGNDPKHQFSLRSSHNLAPKHHLDLMARYVGALPSPAVPAYAALDARYAWQVHRDLELSVTAQNLFDHSHPEFGAAPNRSEIERGVFVRAKWMR